MLGSYSPLISLTSTSSYNMLTHYYSWHEQDPKEIVTSVETCIEEATKDFERQGYNKSSIKTIGITNQRETTIVWDENTGEALYNAIAWPDTRTASLVRELKKRPGADELQPICGLPLSTYPSAVKLTWLLRNVPAVKTAYSAGTLAFGTVDTWLLLKLNPPSSSIYVTDATNASRTMLADLRSLAYSPKLLSFFDLDRDKIHLPTIVPSSDPAAFGRLGRGILEGVPITGCLGDQSAALVGQCGFQPGQAKNTYGTGCFLLYNVGPQPVFSSHGLLATVAYHFGGHDSSSSGNDSGGGGGGPIYALEGSIAVAGSGVKFLVNNLGLAQGSSEVTALAGQVEDSGGVVFVTAFSGLFAPYWIDDARGTLFGITQHTRKGHVARATLEATCFQTKAILDAMEKDSGHKLEMLAVDGGMSNSDLCMQVRPSLFLSFLFVILQYFTTSMNRPRHMLPFSAFLLFSISHHFPSSSSSIPSRSPFSPQLTRFPPISRPKPTSSPSPWIAPRCAKPPRLELPSRPASPLASTGI